MKANGWQAIAAPTDRTVDVRRWQFIDVFRSSTAIGTLFRFVLTLELQLA